MTQDEMLEIVIKTHAIYDRMLVPKDAKMTAGAWLEFLSEFDAALVWKVIPNICMKSEYLPRPMEIRRGVINYLNKIDPPPVAPGAWGQYVQIMADATSGSGGREYQIHTVLASTIRALGAGAAQVNGQYDRKMFEAIYDQELEKWRTKTYGINNRD
jgi:hypothetical protein